MKPEELSRKYCEWYDRSYQETRVLDSISDTMIRFATLDIDRKQAIRDLTWLYACNYSQRDIISRAIKELEESN